MLTKSLIVVLALGIGLSSAPVQADPQAEKAAVTAALAWLKLVDARKYKESWEQASKMVQAAVSQADWTRQMTLVSGMFGGLVSRKLATAQFHTSLPGAPDGKYVVITFTSVFKNKATAVETITPALEGGKWKVSGYYIK